MPGKAPVKAGRSRKKVADASSVRTKVLRTSLASSDAPILARGSPLAAAEHDHIPAIPEEPGKLFSRIRPGCLNQLVDHAIVILTALVRHRTG